MRADVVIYRVSARTPPPRRFTAACVQFEVRREDVSRNLAEAEAGLRAAVVAGAKLAVLPEAWTTSLLPRYTPAHVQASLAADERIVELSRQLDLVVVGGGVEEQNGNIFN